MLITAPERLKSDLRGLSTAKLVMKVSRFRPGTNLAEVETATKFALRSVARRHQRLSVEISELDERLDRLVVQAAPELLAVEGVSIDTAASLLIAAGDNPERLKNEAYSDAHLRGAAPIPASSGKSVRHRLNRHGERDAAQSPLRDRYLPHEPRRAHSNLRSQEAHRGGQDQQGDHPLPQTLHRP